MKKIFVLLFIMAFPGLLLARKQGQALIDSLLPELSKAIDDTNKVKIMTSLTTAYATINPDEGFKYGRRALDLSQQLNYPNGKGGSYNSIGVVYKNQGNYSEALKNHEIALNIYESINDRSGISACHNNIGNILATQSNYTEALKNYEISLKIDQELSDREGIGNVYNNIGLIYINQGNYSEALKNYEASLKIKEALGNKAGMGNCYNNIGIVYDDQGNYTEAIRNYTAALKIRETLGDKAAISESYNNLGNTYLEKGDYPDARRYFEPALKIKEQLGDKEGIAMLSINIAQLLIKQNETKEALQHATKALALAKEIGEIEYEKEAYFAISLIDSANGNYKAAYNDFKVYKLYNDSIFTDENSKRITQLTMQFALDKKVDSIKIENDKKIAHARAETDKQRLIKNGFIGGFALMLLSAGVFYSQRNVIKKSKKRSEELLLNILPAAVAEELKTKGSAKAHLYDDVTVLFTDFVNFTQASEHLTPQGVVEELHNCFMAFDNIISRYNIEKIKTIGDAYLAVCGLPKTDPNHAVNIVSAGIEICNFMKDRYALLRERSFEVRIGVHSGSVVAGIVGVKKFAYDIWGDTVNTAARMEQNCEPGRVNISETTYELVKDKFYSESRGEIEAKGKGMMKMYYANAPKTAVY